MSRDDAAPSATATAAGQSVRAWRPSFQGVLQAITAVLHVAAAVAYWHVAARSGAPMPLLLAGAIAGSLALALGPLVIDTLPDRPRPRWRVLLVELPYLTHWCALWLALAAIAAGSVVWAIQLALGLERTMVGAWAWHGYVAGWVLAGWGIFVRRHLVRVRRVQVSIRGLGHELEGFRIVQLSDLHIGAFSTEASGCRWVELANRERADLAVVTGDFVSGGVDYHRAIARVVLGLKAEHGVAIVAGNHDYFGDGEPLFGMLGAGGVKVLRTESLEITRGEAKLNGAGIDDRWTGRADLGSALRGCGAGPTVLLAHDPVIFPAAARAGVALTLSGHTHGGQVAVPFLARWLNVSSWAHRYQLGMYANGDSALLVSAGLGTTGPPIRLGVAPEIVVVELRSMRPRRDRQRC